MKKFLMAAVALAASAMPTMAAAPATTTWYQLRFYNGKCERAKQSPAQIHEQLRQGGVVDNVNVDKNDSGAVYQVAVSFMYHGQPTIMWFYPSADRCDAARQIAVDEGRIPDLNDLK